MIKHAGYWLRIIVGAFIGLTVVGVSEKLNLVQLVTSVTFVLLLWTEARIIQVEKKLEKVKQ